MIEQLQRIVALREPALPEGYTAEDAIRMAPKLYALERKRWAFEAEHERQWNAIIESRGRDE